MKTLIKCSFLSKGSYIVIATVVTNAFLLHFQVKSIERALSYQSLLLSKTVASYLLIKATSPFKNVYHIYTPGNPCNIKRITGKAKYRNNRRRLILRFLTNRHGRQARFLCRIDDGLIRPCKFADK